MGFFKRLSQNKKVSRYAVFAPLLAISIVMVALGQNCSQPHFEDSGLNSSAAVSFSEEDDIWFRLESARIKIRQLRAIAGFSDEVSNEVLEGKTPIVLASALENDVTSLEKMLIEDKISANSTDVIKKYTSLIDLLSNARDMLLAFYMNQGFTRVTKDLEDAKNSLQKTIDLLTASLESLRLSHKQLQADVINQGQQMTQIQIELMRQINELRTQLEARVDQVRQELLATIAQVDRNLATRIAQNEAEVARVEGRVVDVEKRVKELEDKLKPQVEYLIGLAEQTRRDLDKLTAEFEKLRTGGETDYKPIVDGWTCYEDLVAKNGAALLNLSPSIGENCIHQKEQTLYTICVAKYPTFCGQCKGKTMEQCEYWNDPRTGLSAREKLEILMNIRQEIAIEYLAQQTAIHNRAIFGDASCKKQCLTLVDGVLPSQCTVSDLKKCGIEGQLAALHVADTNLNNNLVSLSSTLNSRIDLLDNDFQAARDYSNQRFASLQSYVDENLAEIRKTTEQKFTAITNALAGIEVVSKPLYDEMTNVCIASSQALAQASASQTLIAAPLNTIPGWNVLAPRSIYEALEVDIEDALRVTSQSSIDSQGAGSLSSLVQKLMREVFITLDADQNSLPAYDSLLAQRVATACPASVKASSPFTNVVGHDPMELIALGVARRALMGDGAASVNGVKTIFDKYQTPIIKGSALQQAFFSAALDYRQDVSKAVSATCLQAIDNYTKEVLSSSVAVKTGSSTSVVQALASAEIQATLLSLTEQAKLLRNKLASLEETILQRAVVSQEDPQLQDAIQMIALRLIQASTLNVVSQIKAQECNSITASYRELVPGSGKSQFDLSIQEYLKQKNALAAQNAAAHDALQKQIDELKKQQGNQNVINETLAKKIKDLQDAVGSLPTMQAVQDAINALDIPGIRKCIEDLAGRPCNSNSCQPVDDFTPRITAVRHGFDLGKTISGQACNSSALSSLAFPTSSQFAGGYLTCGVSFRTVNASATNASS
ncbi:MAG: hypothetical protein RBT63_03360, partial [Bdellovibrionales bacterium]|nr:hypothetical protein [Bdellovibrionales bacterium]